MASKLCLKKEFTESCIELVLKEDTVEKRTCKNSTISYKLFDATVHVVAATVIQASTNLPPDSPGQVQNHSGKHSAQYRSPPGK